MQLGDLLEAKKIRRNSKGMKKLAQRSVKDAKRRNARRSKMKRHKKWALSQVSDRLRSLRDETADEFITQAVSDWWFTGDEGMGEDGAPDGHTKEARAWVANLAGKSATAVVRAVGSVPGVSYLDSEWEGDYRTAQKRTTDAEAFIVHFEIRPWFEDGNQSGHAAELRAAIKKANLQRFDTSKKFEFEDGTTVGSGHHANDPAGWDTEVDWEGWLEVDAYFEGPQLLDGDDPVIRWTMVLEG